MSAATPISSADPAPLNLLPGEIQTNSRYNARPFSTQNTDDEDKMIERLAVSMEELGQFDECILTPERVLIAGHRRRKAAMLINERRSARGVSLFRLRCRIDNSGGDMRRKCIQSNVQRRESTAMDMAYVITGLRKEYDWQGWPGTRKIAEYLGINQASVVQYDHLMKCEKELQNRVHSGEISMQSALDLIKAIPSPKERADTVRRAEEIQAENQLEKTLNSFQAGKKSLKRATEAISQSNHRLEHPAIVAAIRERHRTNPVGKQLNLSRSELLQGIAQLDAEIYPEPARDFVHYVIDVYARGQGTVEELKAKFGALIMQPIAPQRERGKAPKEAIAS